MSSQINTLIFILILGALSFSYLKLAIEPLVLKKEFRVWVVTWFAVTILAFLSSSFLLFISLSALFIYAASKYVENKLALFCMLLFTMPNLSAKLSVILTISYARELIIMLLIPLFMAIKPREGLPKYGKLATDKLILFYVILYAGLYLRGMGDAVNGTTFTEGIRQGFYLLGELFLPYFVASRYIKDFNQLKTVMIAFTASCMVAACIAMFEIRSSWLLYGNLNDFLNIDRELTSYLGRSGLIRAMASLDHPLVLGLVMLIALGFYLAISQLIKNKFLRMIGLGIIAGGIIAPLSRGPWLGAFFMLLVYLGIGHNKGKNFTILISALLVAIPLLYATPGGNKIIDLLPFVGTVEKQNVDYRADLFNQSILVIQNHPLFGVYNPYVEPELQVMKQGQGIIDLVNYYLELTLYTGLVGLFIFVCTFSIIMSRLYAHLKKFEDQTTIEYAFGKSLFAALSGALLAVVGISSIGVVNIVLFMMAGIIVSYIRVTSVETSNNNEISSTPKEKVSYPTSRVVRKVMD